MNQNFSNTVVTNLPPIVTRRVNVVHTYQIINQPHICEDVTQICNHCIKRHQYIPRPICCKSNDYQEENLGMCPGMMNQAGVFNQTSDFDNLTLNQEIINNMQ